MPIYTYQCCEKTTTQYSKIADRMHGPKCPECGEEMQFKITPTMVHVRQFDNYQCPVTRETVSTERQRRNIMAQHDLVDANDYTGPAGEAA